LTETPTSSSYTSVTPGFRVSLRKPKVGFREKLKKNQEDWVTMVPCFESKMMKKREI